MKLAWGNWWERWLRKRESAPGARGEDLAERFLRRERGFCVLKRNWRNPADRREEIDLVGMEGEVLVFVEVKSRSARDPLAGYYAVDWRKRKVLRRACTAFLQHWGHPRPSYRFDIVSVESGKDGDSGLVRHYPNVELFGK